MSLGNIFTTIIENFASLLAWRIVYEYEQAIRWTFGKPGRLLSCGWHFYIWGVQTIDKVDATINIIDLGPQTIRSADGLSCTTRVGVEFYIRDAKNLFLSLQDDEIERGLPTVATIARGAVATVLGCEEFADLWREKLRIESTIRDELQALVQDFGLEIQRTHIAEYAVTKNYRVYGDSEPIILE